MKAAKEKCVADVWSGFSTSACGKTASLKNEKTGKWYCKTHRSQAGVPFVEAGALWRVRGTKPPERVPYSERTASTYVGSDGSRSHIHTTSHYSGTLHESEEAAWRCIIGRAEGGLRSAETSLAIARETVDRVIRDCPDKSWLEPEATER